MFLSLETTFEEHVLCEPHCLRSLTMIECFGLGRKHVHLRFVRRFKQIMFFQLVSFTAKTGGEGWFYFVSWQRPHEFENMKNT